jgi:D-alanyl-D-alanine carboxypeptidase
MHNHNSLLGQVKGVDGIKTGYTEASGYNLVSSVRRDARHIVAVVLGGTSNAARDARMRQLIEEHISQASVRQPAPAVMEAAGRDNAHVDTPVENVGPAIPAPSPPVAPSGSVEPTLASVNADQSESSKPQTEASKAQEQAATPPAQAAKAIALAKLPTAHSRRPASKAAKIDVKEATSVPAVAHDPKGSW